MLLRPLALHERNAQGFCYARILKPIDFLGFHPLTSSLLRGCRVPLLTAHAELAVVALLPAVV